MTPLELAIDTLALSRSTDGEKASEFVPVREESREETLSELQYYLGKRIVQDLMSQVPDSPEDTQVLLHKAEPYLTTFLGRKAATQICFKISQAGAAI